MAERKNKRASENSGESFEDEGILLEPARVELGSGYALAIRYDENERPVVDIKTYGQVDFARLRREIQGIFPEAQIRKKGQPQTVTAVKKNTRKLHARKQSQIH